MPVIFISSVFLGSFRDYDDAVRLCVQDVDQLCLLHVGFLLLFEAGYLVCLHDVEGKYRTEDDAEHFDSEPHKHSLSRAKYLDLFTKYAADINWGIEE